MRNVLNQGKYTITYNEEFETVINQCAAVPRTDQAGTWIHSDMIDAYHELHGLGYAVSVEAWADGSLAGGLYGLKIGKIFYGESMFSLQSNASKAALIQLAGDLVDEGFLLIDCQQDTPHMRSMGAELMDSGHFLKYLKKNRLIYLSMT